MRITGHSCQDLRFPTSRESHGSDAMNPDPDYSCAYIVFETDDALEGHGLTFTIGRGTELCVAAIDLIAPAFYGRLIEDLEADPGLLVQILNADSQIRWLGPEKGVVHLAAAAVINAVWDLMAKRRGLPLWQYVSNMSPADIVRAVDFRHISDFLSPAEALERLTQQANGRNARIAEVLDHGYLAYTTSAGWIGYSDADFVAKLQRAYADGWRHFKLKVGRDQREDIRRCSIFRETLGEKAKLAIDANQVWDVDEAIAWTKTLAPFDVLWIEEPTSPDDILGHLAIAQGVRPAGIGVATGEHAHNRIMFKQFLQAGAIDFCQIDACRLGGVNEVLAVLLMADKAGVPVCPHAGGVGLCEYVQHLSMIDYVCISGTQEGRLIEYSGQLHEHFLDPVRIKGGRYLAPLRPGYSAEMHPASRASHAFPDGWVWQEHKRQSGA